jgi:hypothetical protein
MQTMQVQCSRVVVSDKELYIHIYTTYRGLAAIQAMKEITLDSGVQFEG